MEDSNNNNFNMDVSSVKFWRGLIKVIVYFVYLAGALFATITFSQHVSNQFPEAPLMRAMAFAGAWANFLSLAVMPLAKEYWISGRLMTLTAWIAWVFEVIIVVLNVLSAYGSDWALWWTSLSPASPVYVILVWGLMWYLDPQAKVHQAQLNFYNQAQSEWQHKLTKAMQSEEIQNIMNQGAQQAATQFAERSLNVTLDKTHGKSRQKNQQQNQQPSTLVQPSMVPNNAETKVVETKQKDNSGNFTNLPQ